jgi:short-subunit dehydrogenase
MSESKAIILTGASRGIGLAIAQYLLRASHRLVLVARSAEPLQKLKSEYPGQVEYIAADLADFSVCNTVLVKGRYRNVQLNVECMDEQVHCRKVFC